MKRVNIGCGPSPISGWYNYDNSFSVRLASYPTLTAILCKLGILTEGQKKLISVVSNSNIVWADATKRIPLPDDSVEVLHTSHMVEHLDRHGIHEFLKEARHVLVIDGIIRVVVPDLRKYVNQYIAGGDADAFVGKTMLAGQKSKTMFDKLKYLIIGDRHHLWMYDGPSMCRLVSAMGFKEP